VADLKRTEHEFWDLETDEADDDFAGQHMTAARGRTNPPS
jgi:hypothetical protein